MPSPTLDEMEAFARQSAGPRHDSYSSLALQRAAAEYVLRRGDTLAPYTVSVDGKPYASVFAAIRDAEATFSTGELRVVDPPSDARAWEWLEPFERIVFASDGSAELHPFEGSGPPRRAIARLLLRENYVPRTEAAAMDPASAASTGGVPARLDPLPDAVAFVRTHGVVPFTAALVLYFADRRLRIELDLLEDLILRDPRSGRLPLDRKVHRSARVSHAVDEFIAKNTLTVANARALEVLVETHGLTPLEIAPLVGGLREFGASALQGLSARGLATFDRRTGVYRPRFDAFLSPQERAGLLGAPTGPMPNPALRTSVNELLAAADSRATCPLCGDALPTGPRTILCDRCAKEVGLDANAPTSG